MTAKWLPLTILQVPPAMAHFVFIEHPPAVGQLQPQYVKYFGNLNFSLSPAKIACELAVLLYLLLGELKTENVLGFRF